MAKPTKLPIWNTNESNVAEPSASRQSDGWVITGGIPEKPPVQWHNYMWNLIYKWIKWFDESLNSSLDKSVIHNITTDADYTLTAEQNLYSRIEIADTNTFLTTGRNIITDNVEHTFLFVNSTLQTLTVKTSAGTGISVLAGEARQVRNNTINIIEFEAQSGLEIASTAEAQAGTDDTKAISPLKMHEAMLGSDSQQAYIDVTASRASSVVYTNTTGRPILVLVRGSNGSTLAFTVGGIALPVVSTNSSNVYPSAVFIVPNNTTYTTAISFQTWVELR